MGWSRTRATEAFVAFQRTAGTVTRSLVLGCCLVSLGVPAAHARGPDSLADEASAVSDAVVNISATQTVDEKHASGGSDAPDLQQGTPFDDLFEEFFKKRQQQKKKQQQQGESDDDDSPDSPRKSNSLGSGFVIDPAGIVVTNNHVIADANEITVLFVDGQKLRAKVLGRDSKVDIAVLQVKATKPLKAVKFGDSEVLRVGDWVMAVGNPFGLGGTVTAGIVSARHRNIDSGPYDNYIQTDAAINKGNSGGPLFNMAGEVIGINTAILSPSGGSIGIGFATPSSMVQPVIEQLQKYGETRRGWLGVRIQNVDDSIAQSLDLGDVRGALVSGMDPKGPATSSGIQTGDVIVKFDGHEIKESRELPKIVALAPVGKDVAVVLMRNGKEITKTVKLGRLEDGESKAEAVPAAAKAPNSPSATAVQQALGMTFGGLTDEARKKFTINDSVSSGVVINRVEPESPAAQKRLQAGEVLVEINQEPVRQPSDAAEKFKALKKTGKKSALLLVANAQGEVRFVAVPVE